MFQLEARVARRHRSFSYETPALSTQDSVLAPPPASCLLLPRLPSIHHLPFTIY